MCDNVLILFSYWQIVYTILHVVLCSVIFSEELLRNIVTDISLNMFCTLLLALIILAADTAVAN